MPPLDSANPPVSVPQAQQSAFSGVDVDTSDGNFSLREWWFAWSTPEGCYIVAQVHVIISPDPANELEDFGLWLGAPSIQCTLQSLQPRSGSQGVRIGGALSASGSGPSLGVSVGTTVAVDGATVTMGRTNGGVARWEVDISDGSNTARDGAELDFYAHWHCPKCDDVKGLIEAGKSEASFRVEFDTPDTWIADPNYYWNHIQPKKVKKWVPGEGGATIYGFPSEILVDGGASLVDSSAQVNPL